MSYLIRAAKIRAWLEGRDYVLPEDIQAEFAVCTQHRLFINPVYGYRKEQLVPQLVEAILQHVAAP